MKSTLSFPLAIALALAACIGAYAPGLHGGFLFDDAANLPALGQFGPVDNLATFFRYITSGKADPTGRPLSLLSFLIDANNWPAPPFPFKWHNLALHLANGALLATLLRRIGRAQGYGAAQVDRAALFSATLWLLHPLFVSTVLYVVQREAMLATFFILAGLHVWMTGRQRMLDGRGGAAWLLFAWLGFTALAFLAKPNGLLLPLLSVVIDATLPPTANRFDDDRYRRWRRWVALPCTALVAAGVSWVLLKSIGHPPPPPRDFTLWQRTITQPGILLEYVRLLFLGDSHYGSLFHDQYRAATSLIAPWWTLPSVMVCAASAVFAWRLRRRMPALALAIGFFLGGHLLESSSLALELYFEHRNYLPAMMLFWPLGIALSRIPTGWLRATALLTPLLLCAALTRSTASLWAQPLLQAEVWAANAPESPRAQAWAAQLELQTGHAARARSRIALANALAPSEAQVALTGIFVSCDAGGPTLTDWQAAGRALREGPRDPGALLASWVQTAMDMDARGSCPGMNATHLFALLDAAAANPAINRLPGRMQDIAHLRGQLALAQNDPSAALAWFNDALARAPAPAVALEQAAMLGSRGYAREGLAHLDYFNTLEVAPVRPTQGMPWLHATVLAAQDYWPTELAHMRQTLQADARASSK